MAWKKMTTALALLLSLGVLHTMAAITDPTADSKEREVLLQNVPFGCLDANCAEGQECRSLYQTTCPMCVPYGSCELVGKEPEDPCAKNPCKKGELCAWGRRECPSCPRVHICRQPTPDPCKNATCPKGETCKRGVPADCVPAETCPQMAVCSVGGVAGEYTIAG